MRPHGQTAGHVVRTIDDILSQLRKANQASSGTYAGDPLAAAQAAQAQGHNAPRAYLYQQQQDMLAQQARFEAQRRQAELAASQAGTRPFRDVVSARQGAQRAESTLGLRQQVEAARVNLDFLRGPEGAAYVKEQRQLNKQLESLRYQTEAAEREEKGFAERLAGVGGVIGRVGGGFAVAAAAAFGAISEASPTHAAYATESAKLAAAEIGTALLPAAHTFGQAAQEFGKFVRELRQTQSLLELPHEKGVRPFWIRTFGAQAQQTTLGVNELLRGEFGRAGITLNPFRSARASIAAGKEAGLKAEEGAENDMRPVFPGGRQLAEYTDATRYSQALNIAGLEAGGPEDPQTKLLRLQLENLEQINKNTAGAGAQGVSVLTHALENALNGGPHD
jgi:hypothetical protein